MISKNFVSESYELTCDLCGREAEEIFDDFMDAASSKKSLGWKSRKINGDWCDICPDCLEEEQDRLPRM